MRKLFLTQTILFIALLLTGCQGGEKSGTEDLDTAVLAVPPMFDAPLPAKTNGATLIVPLVSDSTKKDSTQHPVKTTAMQHAPDSNHAQVRTNRATEHPEQAGNSVPAKQQQH